MPKKILSCFLVLLLIAFAVGGQVANQYVPGNQIQQEKTVKPFTKSGTSSSTLPKQNTKSQSSGAKKTNDNTMASINGQWRGYFNSEGDIVLSGGNNTEYVLELEIEGSTVTGYSYTYFDNRKYYVICSLAGTYYKSTKSLSVTETARIKGLTSPGWSDCFQTHILTYQKHDNTEELAGKWVSAPGNDCGSGTTTLTRRTVSKDLSSFNKSQNRTAFSTSKPKSKFPDFSDKNKKSNPVVINTPRPKTQSPATTPQKDPVIKEVPNTTVEPEVKKQTEKPTLHDNNNNDFGKRNSSVLRTIEIKNETFRVDLYDNGYIDGDSISLFYNGKLLLSHQRLSDKPITLTLDATTNRTINELTMYAENLGEIPPNTALMVVTDGNNRYEVRIASDMEKSGTIRFIHNDKKE